VAFLCSLIIPVYFLRLMADGRKLERRLAYEKPLLTLDGAFIPDPDGTSPDLSQGFSSELYS
jgi:hypothetical protein